MNILVTGAQGFIGKNLVENLKAIRDKKNRTRPGIAIERIDEYGRGSALEELEAYCARADFVFHLAGVNRPKDPKEFQEGNVGLFKTLLETLKRQGNRCPVMFSSSVQASLSGRFGVSEYGLSKKAGEDLLFAYEASTGAKALAYRFPNVVGKWGRPNYNSAVTTFCYNIARDLPISVTNPDVEMELLFIDDLIEELLDALEGREHRCELKGVMPVPDINGRYCYAPITHKVALGKIVELLQGFHDQPSTLLMPPMPSGSLEKKLYSMYLSYLPAEKIAYDLTACSDERGSFTEILKTLDCGQVSVNVTKPGVTKGEHWHNNKWELFLVVSGHGLIQERQIGSEETLEFEVSGDHLRAVHMLPGYTHNLINLSDTENLVTLIWANELFDPKRPDTFYEPVIEK